MTIFVAELETRHTNSHGYGETPHQALEALLRCWRDEYAPMSGADPDYPEEIRDDIAVYEVELGKGYVIGTGDDLTRPVAARGSNSMFDGVFESFRKPAP